MVFKKTKRIIFMALLVVFTNIFSGCVWNAHSEKQIQNIVSNNLSKINIGMTVDHIYAIIGKPEGIYPQENTEHYRKWMKSIQNVTTKFYPEELFYNLNGTVTQHTYNYTVSLNDGTGFSLYYDDNNTLIGWSCNERVIPNDWDEICAKQDKLRLSSQQK